MVPSPRCRILQLVAIGRTVQGLELLRAVEVQVFGRRQNCDITAGFEKARNRHPLDDMLPIVPLIEILLFRRISVHHRDQHPLPRKRHAVASLRSNGSQHDGNYSAFHGRSPDKLGIEHVREYRLHLMARGLKAASSAAHEFGPCSLLEQRPERAAEAKSIIAASPLPSASISGTRWRECSARPDRSLRR